MAEAFLGVLLDNLNSLIQNELGLLKGYKKEMKKLSSTLSTIQAVLEDAEEKQLKEKEIQNWLRDLKDTAYELDDILDVCQTEASKKVHDSYFAKFSANLFFRRKIGIRMRDAREKLDTISGDRMNFHLKSETVGDRRAEVMAWRETGSVVTQTEVYGREEDKEKIVESLVKDVAGSDDISIYPILGMGGLGKTTLAQLVYNDDRIKRHFECTIWVFVFEDFNVKRLITEMITSLGGQVNEASNLADLQRRLRDMLNGKRYLLVLDDVWNEDEEKWDQLKCTLTCGSKGSSIVVTTRLAKVASIVGTLPPHHLSCVSEHDCWLLFKQRAFGNNTEPPMNILAIAKEIVKKCQGVPLAAKTLGSLMHFKSNENEWLHVKDSELWNLTQKENSILPALRLSYSNLPVKPRQCFAFCAVFPKNFPIQKRNLIHLWMANGFISSNGTLDAEDVGNEVFSELYWRSLIQDFSVDDSRNSNRWYKMHDAEDVGKEVFNELYWRSLIPDFYVDDPRRYKMHDLVHDLAQYVAGDECCTTEAERASKLLSRRTHHVALTFPKETFTIPDALNSVQSLRTLCINSAYSLSDMCFADIPKLPSLRALEIQNAILMELSHSIGNSMHLRYLNLSGTEIRFLPKSLCSLWNLQILNLEGCRALQQFPHDMRRLKNLQYLFIDGCYSLTSMPPKLRQMSALRILPFFIVGRRRGYRLSELAGLNLSGRLHIKHLEMVGNHMDAAEARLGEKQNLRELILSWESDGLSGLQGNAEKVLHALEPPSNLVELTIWGYSGNSMPLWMSSPVLNNVVSIYLLHLNCLQLPPLGGKLPSLKYLRIHGMEHVKYINNYCGGEEVKVFPSLEVLEIWWLPNLEKLSIEQGRNTFPCLNIMLISGCPKLTLPCLPSLTELSVKSCCSEVLLSSISNLNKLTSLSIDDNDEVMTLPDSVFMNLTSLQSLTIGYFTKLESLPEQGMRCLKSLQSLIINYCDRLNCLSDGLKHLTALKHLEICECPELQKRYQKEIGKDWHKIAHIPFVNVW